MLDNKGFDLWADEYDESVDISQEKNEYPFAGYRDVLNYIYKQVRERNGVNILDIGFGTGILTTRLYNVGYDITGIDFSSNMIDIAKQKMPEAELLNWDFSRGLPDEIKNKYYDFIISTYAIHHLADTEKIDFIKALSGLLTVKGKILIGDISFEKRQELSKCREEYFDSWDNDEVYFVAEEIMESLDDSFCYSYAKLSHCAGVLTVSTCPAKE